MCVCSCECACFLQIFCYIFLSLLRTSTSFCIFAFLHQNFHVTSGENVNCSECKVCRLTFMWGSVFSQGFTYPVRTHFLENILEMIGYRLTPYNQIDDYGQEKVWKMQKQAQSLRKRKSQIASSVEVSRKYPL